jgi:hypothetical protein
MMCLVPRTCQIRKASSDPAAMTQPTAVLMRSQASAHWVVQQNDCDSRPLQPLLPAVPGPLGRLASTRPPYTARFSSTGPPFAKGDLDGAIGALSSSRKHKTFIFPMSVPRKCSAPFRSCNIGLPP